MKNKHKSIRNKKYFTRLIENTILDNTRNDTIRQTLNQKSVWLQTKMVQLKQFGHICKIISE